MGKFKIVDLDESQSLSPREMESLIFPLESESLAEQALEDGINDLDEDMNRVLTFQEYGRKYNLKQIGDPETIESYKRRFASLDSNNSGVLEHEEIVELVRPSKEKLFAAQAKEILVHFDQNMDNLLDLVEARQNSENFLASRLGDLSRLHAEL